MIPKLVDIKSVWDVLPPGIHDASMEEIEQSFVTSDARRRLFEGFKQGVQVLRQAGCKTVFLDGSYVTEKLVPGDFDVCWDPSGVEHKKLDPVLLDFSLGRKNQKLKYGGEFFPASSLADGSNTFVEYFQNDKNTGKKKGILRIKL